VINSAHLDLAAYLLNENHGASGTLVIPTSVSMRSYAPSDAPDAPAPFLNSIKFQRGIPQAKGKLTKFAHLSDGVSSTFGSHDLKLSMMNRVENLTIEAIAMIVS
jgi:hypothetical protein